MAWALLCAWCCWNGWIVQSKPAKFFYTVLGIDGWSQQFTGDNYYLCGEWFLGCIIIIYLVLPLLKKISDNKIAFLLTISFLYGGGILLCEHYSINAYTFPAVRILEFGIGMMFTQLFIHSEHVLMEHILLAISICIWGIILFVPFNIYYMHQYVLCSVSGFILLYEINKYLCKVNIYRGICSWFASISYCCFLLHHHILGSFSEKYFGIAISTQQKYMLFFAQVVTIVLAGYILNKITKKLVEK